MRFGAAVKRERKTVVHRTVNKMCAIARQETVCVPPVGAIRKAFVDEQCKRVGYACLAMRRRP
jgi:hypothetical protein